MNQIIEKFKEFRFSLILFIGLCLLLWLTYLKGYWPDRGFLCPVEYSGEILIRSDSLGDGYFGARRKGGRTHNGLDLGAPVDTPVLSSRRGRVIETGNHPDGYGKYVEIMHKGGFVTIYAHLSRIVTSKGEMVRKGEIIGRVGKSGNAGYKSIQPHVHFEIKKNGETVDPMDFIK